MAIVSIKVGDTLRLKKAHPCGGYLFSVLRVGSEVRIKCQTCQRDMTVDRIKLEKAIRQISQQDGSGSDQK